MRSVKGYAGIMAPNTLESRLILEDIPMGLVPMAALGDLAGVDTPLMDMTICLASSLLKRDFTAEGRTLDRLGIEGLTKEELLDFVK